MCPSCVWDGLSVWMHTAHVLQTIYCTEDIMCWSAAALTVWDLTLKLGTGLGLVGDGVEDLVDLGVEIWLPETPFTIYWKTRKQIRKNRGKVIFIAWVCKYTNVWVEKHLPGIQLARSCLSFHYQVIYGISMQSLTLYAGQATNNSKNMSFIG